MECEACDWPSQHQLTHLETAGCDRCHSRERYGADMRLPDLRQEIAQCRRHGQMHDACMVRYVDLVPLGQSLTAAAFIHLCQPTVAKQSLFYGCLLPGSHGFLRGSAYCSEWVAKKLADSYPKIICVLVDLHRVPLTEDIYWVLGHKPSSTNVAASSRG